MTFVRIFIALKFHEFKKLEIRVDLALSVFKKSAYHLRNETQRKQKRILSSKQKHY